MCIYMIMVLFKLNVHDACYLYNQVITKVNTVSYRPFSFCRLNGIKETVSCYIQDVLALVVEDLVHPPRLLVKCAPRDTYTMMMIL